MKQFSIIKDRFRRETDEFFLIEIVSSLGTAYLHLPKDDSGVLSCEEVSLKDTTGGTELQGYKFTVTDELYARIKDKLETIPDEEIHAIND